MGEQWKVSDFILGGSKITADGDCSHEIKICLLLGRKAVTNLDSILKGRDITLPTKICIVIAMVSPVVMNGFDSWTIKKRFQFSSVESLSHVRPFVTPWTAAHQASLSITYSQSLFKLMSIESVISSNHLIFCCPLHLLPSIFSSIGVFSKESFVLGGQRIGVSASASVLPMNIQYWWPFRLTGLISLLSKGLSRVFSKTTVWNHQLFGAQISLWSNSHIHTWLLKKKQTFEYMDLCQ